MTTAPSNNADLVSFANELADSARKVILPFWRQPIDVESKLEHDRPIAESPVTIADRQAEEVMRQLIEERYPSHGIYGEEFGQVRTDAEYVWVLDPIDGTKSFITGKPLFGTLIACLKDGVPIIGVIDQCVLKERWVGVVGQGTTLNGKPVSTSGCATLKESMMYATTPHMFHKGEESDKFEKMCNKVLRPLYGADCYAYAIVASGFGADIVVEADLGLYDYCALVPVVEGAGGKMTDWCGRRLTLENHERSKGRVVACANEGLHKEAIAILGKSWRDSFTSSITKDGLVYLVVGVVLGSTLSRSRTR
jgi:inositol-phosphate phosphatase/L-galactose 1-phosphate phosphatase/histidinol-phosphatase